MTIGRVVIERGFLVLLLLLLPAAACLAQSGRAEPVRVVLKGYDPVAYFTENKPVKGDPKFSYDWDGARYLFMNAENRKKFAADPERYEPQFSGYCTGSMARGVRNEADPDAWIIADGRLYLFGAVKFRDIAAKDRERFNTWIADAGKHYGEKK